MTRILLDQGLPRSTPVFLREAGWDVEHVSDIGLSRASDVEIISRAREGKRILCTLDADFHALLAVSGKNSPSVIRIRREGLRGQALASLLLSSWPRIEQAADQGALITITQNTIRVRYLPVVTHHRSND